jgi:glycerol-3-phosphate dehydrogenase
VLNVFGGKITTYRRLAEHALDKIVPSWAGPRAWTAGCRCPAAISRWTGSTAAGRPAAAAIRS